MPNKTNEICLDADWLMENLIIGAMRYGACHRLIDIALLVHRNRDKFNADRVAWLARDMREQASRRLASLKNVHVENDSNDRNKHDAYTLIAQFLEKTPDIRFCDWDWEADCISGKVTASGRIGPLTSASGNYIQTLCDGDIATIITAANILDKSRHCIVVSEYEGRRKETLCFPSIYAEQILDKDGRPTGDYSYHTQYKPVERPQVWLIGDYIKEVKQLNK